MKSVSFVLLFAAGALSASVPADPVFSLAPDEFVLCPGAAPALPPGTDVTYDTLHYDGPNETGIGMTGGGWFKAATRFTAPYRCILHSIIFYEFDYIVDEYVFLWGARSDTTPGTQWDSLLYLPEEPGKWLRVDLREPRFLDEGADFWAGPQVACGPDRFPVGVDEGPQVPLRSFIYWSEPIGWKELPRIGVYRNWNIRAIISRADPHDVGPTQVLAPAGQVWPGPLAPAIRVFNYGEFDESNIEVTCWIDSAGTRVFNRVTTLSGPLWPGESTVVDLPLWQPGPVGSEYEITAFTSLSGDENLGNDTVYATTSVAAAAFSDTILVRRIDQGPPEIDGTVEPAEWSRAAVYDVSDTAGQGLIRREPGSGVVRFLYDNSFLYLACELPSVSERLDGDYFALCMDEDHSGTWARAESSEGRHTALYTTGTDSLIFEAILTTLPYMWRMEGQCPDAYSASSTSGGHLQFEAKIPFGARRGDLTVWPGDTTAVFLYSMAGYGSDCYAWWPQNVTQGTWADPTLYGPMLFEPEVAVSEPAQTPPRPFAGVPTLIRAGTALTLPAGTRLFDLSGRRVLSLPFNTETAPGAAHRSALAVSPGVYFLCSGSARHKLLVTR